MFIRERTGGKMEKNNQSQPLFDIMQRLNKNADSLLMAIQLADQLLPEPHSVALTLCKRCFEVLQHDIKQIEIELLRGGAICHE